MDLDPELDVTLSDGRQSVSFRITPVEGAPDAWAILEPLAPLRVLLGRAGALDTRRRVDAVIAQRLAAGWVPVDAGPAAGRLVPSTPLSPDLALQIGSLLEALDRARPALRAADPSGQLGAACHLFRRQARRFGVGAPGARGVRAQRARRLGELAEQAGDLPAAIFHYRTARASHAGSGVTRRLTRLEQYERTAATPPRGVAHPSRAGGAAGAPSDRLRPPRAQTRLDFRGDVREGCGRGHRPDPGRSRCRGERLTSPRAIGREETDGTRGAAPSDRSGRHGAGHAHTHGGVMNATRVQIVGRIPGELSRRVRAAATRRKVSLNAFLIEALAQAVASPRRAPDTKGV